MNVKKLPERPDDQTMLKLYALYKQGSKATSTAPPGFFDFVGTAKYEPGATGWHPAEEAQQKYIALVNKPLG